MAFSLVQSKTGSVGASNATSVTVTTTATGSGNLLVAYVYVQGASVTITPPASWVQINTTQGINGGTGTVAMYYLPNSPSGTTSFVFSFSASCNAAVAFEEWSGVATSSPLDTSVAQANTVSATAATGTTAALAGSGELAIWGLAVPYTSVLTYSAVTNGYAEDTNANASSSESSKAQSTLFYNTNVGSAATSSGCTMSNAGGNGNTTILAVFKPATSGVALSCTMAGNGTLAGTLSIIAVPLVGTLAGEGTLTGTLSILPPVTPGLTVQIGGNPVMVLARTLTFDNTIGRRAQAKFKVRTTTATHFQQYQQVAIYDKNNVLVFSGYVTNPKEQKPGFQPSLVHDIMCTDQHFLADKRVIAASYSNRTCGEIVQSILSNILSAEGVTVGQIFDGIPPNTTLYPGGNIGLIPNAVFAYATVAQALDAVTKAASSAGIPYYWMIDQNKKLWFVPYTTVVNGTLVDGTQIDQKYNPPSVVRANPTYRNTQYVVGGLAQTVQQTEQRKGDGVTVAWPMGFDLASVPTVTVNSVAKNMGIKGISTGKDFYWQQGSPVITQDSAGTKLVSTDTLQVVYIGQYPSAVISANNAQVSYEKSIDGTSGIIEGVEQDNTITSVSDALTEASQLLTRYATQGTILTFSTLTPGFAPGQLISVNLPMHGLSNQQMLIESVSASDQQDGLNIWYTVIAVLGPYDVSWVQFFSKLLTQRAPAESINVGVSQSTALLAAFTASATVTATLNVTVYACPVVNTTLFPNTTLYPC